MRSFLAALLLFVVSGAWGQTCSPQHAEDFPDQTTLKQGESITAAYNRLPKTGGVIKIPSGNYGCGALLYATGRSVMKNVTLRAADPNNRPVFSCEKGNWIVFGPPMFVTPDVPSVTAPVRLVVENVDLRGWTRWTSVFNAEDVTWIGVDADGDLDGVQRTGKGFVYSEKVGPDQTGGHVVCNSNLRNAGMANQDHNLYGHAGTQKGTGYFWFINSSCSLANGSHCVKSTAKYVRIVGNTFKNECRPGGKCGTQMISVVTGAVFQEIADNDFTWGHPDNPPTTRYIGEGFINVQDRKSHCSLNQPLLEVSPGVVVPCGKPEGGQPAPLYGPIYNQVGGNFHDPDWWTQVCQDGSEIRHTIIRNNTFRNYTNRGNAVMTNGTYPMTASPPGNDCMIPLTTPSTWCELHRLTLAGNRYEGNFPGGHVEVRAPNTCGKYSFPTHFTKVVPTVVNE